MAIKSRGFTLVELLVVISIIAVLLALLFPVARGVLDRAKNTQAKNDVTQIVTAVNAFYTEYGKYPISTAGNDVSFGGGNGRNNQLFNALRGQHLDTALNPRDITFINPPTAKDANNPRNGIGTSGNGQGQFFDPWGTPYAVEIDADYNGQLSDPFHSGRTIGQGAIAWSIGKNPTAPAAKDAITSW